MKRTVFAVVILALLAQGALASIYSEDFSTDPFAARWTQDNQDGTYPMMWTGNWNPGDWHGGLPAEDGNPLDAMYACTSGYKKMYTTDTTVQATNYSVSTDFIISGNTAVADIVVGHYLQRQGDNSVYESSFALGGNGQQSWMGVHGWSGYGGDLVLAEVWYQLVTDVTITVSDVSLVSKIVRLSDSALMGTSPVYTDSTAGRLTTANGYGYLIQLPGTRYWDQAVQTDNFNVVPEPMTMVLLGLGGLLIRKRR